MHRVQFVLIVSLSALVRPVSSVKCRCLVPMLGSRGPAARPPHTCSLWDTNTNANGLKFSAGVYIIIVLSTITNVLSTEPIYKSRVCPHTFPECSGSAQRLFCEQYKKTLVRPASLLKLNLLFPFFQEESAIMVKNLTTFWNIIQKHLIGNLLDTWSKGDAIMQPAPSNSKVLLISAIEVNQIDVNEVLQQPK